MNVEYFIAKRLFSAKENNNRYTKPILYIAILAIGLSVAVMLLSIMIVTGFKKDISDKIIGFGGHITVSNFTNNKSYESEPINVEQDVYSKIKKQEGIKSINVFATKTGILKTENEILGVVLKGVSSDFDWNFFNNNLVEGAIFNINDSVTTNNILISQEIAQTLQLNLEDDLFMYFVDNPPRVRKFTIAGIYHTELTDFDKLFIIGDIKHIRRLNSWKENQVGGFEIAINNFNDLDMITDQVYNEIDSHLNAESIREKNPQLFDWLALQDVNVMVILILMLIVGVVNMITALLILIIERTSLIGILKSIGATNWSIRKVFLYNATGLILQGLLLGNLFALSIGFLQKKFSLIALDPQSYYMSTVPINFDLTHIFILNLISSC